MQERVEQSERSGTGRGAERPVHATPYGSPRPQSPRKEAPVGEIHVDDSMNDDVYTAFTPISNESIPQQREYRRRGSRRNRPDDDTVTREKKANAIDVD